MNGGRREVRGGGILHAIPIEQIDLNVRSYHQLKRAGIDTLADLTARSELDLAAIPNFGKKSIEGVKEALQRQFDLSLADESSIRDWRVSEHHRAALEQIVELGECSLGLGANVKHGGGFCPYHIALEALGQLSWQKGDCV